MLYNLSAINLIPQPKEESITRLKGNYGSLLQQVYIVPLSMIVNNTCSSISLIWTKDPQYLND